MPTLSFLKNMIDSRFLARRESRKIAVKAFFCYLFRGCMVDVSKCLFFVLENSLCDDVDDFAKKLLDIVIENYGKSELVVRAYASDFAFEKIALINKVLLILGVVEIKFLGTPSIVVIDEYIELAKQFGEEKSANLVNGVLDNYQKTLGLVSGKR